MCISKALALTQDLGFPMGRIICDNKIVSLSSCNYLSILTALTSGSPQLLSQLPFLPHCSKLSTCSKEYSLFRYFLGAQNEGYWRTHYLVPHTLWNHILTCDMSQDEPLISRWCRIVFCLATHTPPPTHTHTTYSGLS